MAKKPHVEFAEARIAEAKRDRDRILDLSGNNLSSLPESLGELTHLEVLALSGNRLRRLPDSLGQLTKLGMLFVQRNRLSMLPESLGQLTQLKDLYLGQNQLSTLPDCVGQLPHLRELSVPDNKLSALPDSLGQLMQLKELDVSDNKLIGLPESLRRLTKLERLFLHGNDNLGIPAEVLGAECNEVFGPRRIPAAQPAEILDYYFRLRTGRRPLNEAKLILVGRGGAGKSSIVERLVYDRFEKGRDPTIGIQITEWPLRLNGMEDVRLNIWDFGGQEIMHATHQFFFTQRSLYVLVLNGREGGEEAEAEKWLKLIESFGTEGSAEGDRKHAPVIVVLNKINEHPFDLNRRGLEQKYPFIRCILRTDCDDRTGIDELRRTIERETDRLEHLRDAFPAAWFSIKDRLASMAERNENYLSFDEYRAICREHNETDPAAQESLAFYLHSLGIALNYRDDPRLRDKHVLNPHWVTNGIYKILNSQKLADQKGTIRVTDVGEILDPAVYPREMHHFLFDLMKKFELCFRFPDDDGNYLIPELLDKQEPETVREFRPAECLNFQYHYPILPEGLLPRFIVRTHVLSAAARHGCLGSSPRAPSSVDADPAAGGSKTRPQPPADGSPQYRWRSGVVLQFEGNRALVKADVQDKRVMISVTGPAAGRRRLLAVIRSDFEHIHRSFYKLDPTEIVPVPGRPDVIVPYHKLRVLEDKGKEKFEEVVGEEVIELNVTELLSSVDLEGTRKTVTRLDRESRPVRLFFSYSHKDEALRNELDAHLKLLQRRGLIASWHDRKIEPGEKWGEEIDENLKQADIILFLVSADFIASEYIWEKEMKPALERHKQSEARVIAVILRDLNWKTAPFAELQVLPKDGLAVTQWPDRDSAWRNVSEGIERVAEEVRKHRDKN